MPLDSGMGYSDTLQDHFQHPRNVGVIEAADSDVSVSNPACGDIMQLTLRIADNHVIEARFKTMGCPAAIAAGSVMTELLLRRSLDETVLITREEIDAALGGLPPQKAHAAVLAEDAIKAAVKAYRQR